MTTETTTATHTPGPWTRSEDRIGTTAGTICVIRRYDERAGRKEGRWLTKGEQDANARLIAAAPDLLEAVKATEHQLGMARLQERTISPSMIDSMLIQLRRALDKTY